MYILMHSTNRYNIYRKLQRQLHYAESSAETLTQDVASFQVKLEAMLVDRDRHAQRARRAQGVLKQLRSVYSRDALHSQGGSIEEQGEEEEDELFDVRPVPEVIHTTHPTVPPLPHQPVSLQAMFSTMPNIPPLHPPIINQHSTSIVTAGAAVPTTQAAGVAESINTTPATTAVPPAGAMLNLTYPSASRSSDVQEILRALGL